MNTKTKILYIDDEEINTELFEINFSMNYCVVTGLSGFDGMELLKKHPDTNVVISDLKMPEMNGIEFAKEARKIYSNIVFIILSGFEETKEIKEALEAGLIHVFVGKPFKIKELKEIISDYIK